MKHKFITQECTQCGNKCAVLKKQPTIFCSEQCTEQYYATHDSLYYTCSGANCDSLINKSKIYCHRCIHLFT